jgi:two-component system NarL family response regulator
VSRGDEDVYRALQAGAATYLLKDTAFEDLVAQRPRSARRRPARVQRAGRPVLAPREIEVLELLRRGLRNREIAASLAISEETVKSHVKNILAKLDVRDRTAAIDVVLHRGILHFR